MRHHFGCRLNVCFNNVPNGLVQGGVLLDGVGIVKDMPHGASAHDSHIMATVARTANTNNCRLQAERSLDFLPKSVSTLSTYA